MAVADGATLPRPNGSAVHENGAPLPDTHVDGKGDARSSEQRELERILGRSTTAHGLSSMDLAPFLAPDYDPQTYANLIIEAPQSASPAELDGDAKPPGPDRMGSSSAPTRRLLEAPTASSSKAIDVEGDVSVAVGRLNLAIDDIDRLIRDEVTANAHDLLAHTTSLLDVRPTLTTLRAALDALSAHRDKLIQRIATPHAELRQAALRQAKIRQAQALVRRAEKFVRLVRRLQTQMDALMAVPPRGAAGAASEAKRLERLGEEEEGEGEQQQQQQQQQAGVADEDLMDEEAGEQRGRGLARAALNVSEITALVHPRPPPLPPKSQGGEDAREGEEDEDDEDMIPLTSLDFVNACLPLVERSREKVTDLMEDMVVMGLRDLSPLLLSTSLQTAFNLGQLADLVRDLLADLTDVIRDRVKAACDINSLSRELGSREPQTQQTATYASYRSRRGAGAGTDSASQSAVAQRWSNALWSRFETLIVSEMGAVCSKVYTLERVLSLKTDKVSGRNYLDDAMRVLGDRPSTIFWNTLSGALSVQTREATRNSAFLSTTLSSGYPRLLRLFQEFFARVSVYTDSTYTHAQQSPETISVLRSVSHLEQNYLAKTSSRFEGIIATSLVPEARQLPTAADGEGLARVATDEIDGARFDPLLLVAVVNTVKEGIRRALNAIQARQIKDSSVYSLQAAATTPAQSLNAGLTSFTYHLLVGLQILLGSDHVAVSSQNGLGGNPRSTAPPQVIKESLKDLVDHVRHLYETQQRGPLLSHLQDDIDESFNKMHYVDFGQPVPDAVSGSGSAYMVELSEKLWFIREQLFSRYDVGHDEKASWTLQVTKYALEHFVWQASLLHPLGEGGKLKLTSDMTELEFAASQLLASAGGGTGLGSGGGLTMADCGESFKALRTFRPMLFFDLAKFSLKEAAGEGEGAKLLQAKSGLDPLVVAHHLLARGSNKAKKNSSVFPWQVLGEDEAGLGKTRQEYLSFIDKGDARSRAAAMHAMGKCIEKLRSQEQVPVDNNVLQVLDLWVEAHQH